MKTVKVRCYICTTQGNKEEMIREEIKRKDKTTYRYFHKDCKNINELNKSVDTGLYRKESKKHNGGKRIIFESFKNGTKILIDQHLNEVKLDFDFMAIESPITNIHNNKIPFLDISDCAHCVNTYKKDNPFNLQSIDEFHEKLNIDIYKISETYDYFYQHPCLNCPFNNLRYKFIFDVGLGKNGYYNAAIEILHTHKVTKSKISYCIKHNIQLIEINTNEIHKNNKKIKCECIWWKDEQGDIQIIGRYKKLFDEGK